MPVLDGILNYFRLKEIVIEDKVAKWLALALLGERQERQVLNYLLLNIQYMGEITKKQANKKTKRSFRTAALALGISIIADALDYLAA
ncbi:MAG: hypothetical protein QN702_08990, partial [Nitrososphaeraceae archaeon]|nr:hypothetical protein [Nitrososphaeraceae archaeon]